jgi:membrane protein
MRMSTGPKPQLRFLVMGAAVGAVLFAVGKQAFDGAIPIYGGGGVSLWRRLAGGHIGGYFSSAVLLAASIARSCSDEALVISWRWRAKTQTLQSRC